MHRENLTKLSAVSAFSDGAQPSSTADVSADSTPIEGGAAGGGGAVDNAPTMPEGLSKMEQVKVRNFSLCVYSDNDKTLQPGRGTL